ncbi:hypothetical protein ILUMI_15751 [Ignelater luminosus]|uniref:Uncharacterized protein n=1 Tax=Ignelater luminosus TaxID=2038154 RepID=A0A8K0CU62_IGNLU|nr:hypothetical protein ILUMI_15751 [Ignelater luminosus]
MITETKPSEYSTDTSHIVTEIGTSLDTLEPNKIDLSPTLSTTTLGTFKNIHAENILITDSMETPIQGASLTSLDEQLNVAITSEKARKVMRGLQLFPNLRLSTKDYKPLTFEKTESTETFSTPTKEYVVDNYDITTDESVTLEDNSDFQEETMIPLIVTDLGTANAF